MPRQTKDKAESQTAERQKARWRYLLRNPNFQKDIDHLCELYTGGEALGIDWRDEVADTWGLARIPAEVVVFWPGSPVAPEDYPALEQYWTQFEISIDFSPVTSTELRDDRFLFFWVDLNYPTADLLPLIEQELRQVMKTRPRSRAPTDKIDFHLQVYDMARTGKTFSEIAHALRSPISTVKSAFQLAGTRIFGAGVDRPSKDALAISYILAGFDPTTHIQTCDVCMSAERDEDFCEPWRRFRDQDQVSQRESTGLDTQHHGDPDTSSSES